MTDKAFQDLLLEELRAIKIRTEGLRSSFEEKLDNFHKEFTAFKLEVVEDRGFQKGKSYFVPAFVSVVVSAIVSFIYKITFR